MARFSCDSVRSANNIIFAFMSYFIKKISSITGISCVFLFWFSTISSTLQCLATSFSSCSQFSNVFFQLIYQFLLSIQTSVTTSTGMTQAHYPQRFFDAEFAWRTNIRSPVRRTSHVLVVWCSSVTWFRRQKNALDYWLQT